MDEAGLSQADLARECGVKPPSVNGWLSGKSKFLRGENLLKAAKALNVSQSWLATGKGSKEPQEFAPLDLEEQELLSYFRMLSSEGRTAVQNVVRGMAEVAPAKKIIKKLS